MSYFMDVVEARVTIARANFDKAAKAIADMPNSEFSLVEGASNDENLHDMLCHYHWEPEYNDDGNIVTLLFSNDRYNNDKLLFDAIAPFVEAGGEILIRGEDSNHWRWAFDGSECKELFGEIIFDDSKVTALEKGRLVRLFNEFIDNSPEIIVKDDDTVKTAMGDTTQAEYIKQLFAGFLESKV